MDQAEGNLKVTDRRLFTSDGELRDEAVRSEESAQSPAQGAAESPESPARRAEKRAGAPPRVTLSAFIISLATQAAGLMGGASVDLDAAQQVIGALEMLQEKTEAKRTEDETKLLEAVLFDLRMAFVSVAKEPVS